MPGTYVDNAYNRRLGRVGMPRGSMPVSCSGTLKTYVDNPYNRRLGRVGMPHGTAVVSKNGGSSVSHETYVDNAYNRRLGRVGMPRGSMPVSCSGTLKTYVDKPFDHRLGQAWLPQGVPVLSQNGEYNGSSSQSPYVDYAQDNHFRRVQLPFSSIPVSRDSFESSCGSSVGFNSTNTYAENPHNSWPGQVGLPHAAAVVSKSSGFHGVAPVMREDYSSDEEMEYESFKTRIECPEEGGKGCSSQRTFVDNSQNRYLAEAGLPFGYLSISRNPSESSCASAFRPESTTTNVDNPFNRSLGRVGLQHGTAVVSNRGESNGISSQKTNVDSAQNRRLGGGGLHTGFIPTSRDSFQSGCASFVNSESTKTYVDNPYNRRLGRVGLPHGAAVVSKSGSNGISSQNTNVDSAQNRRFGGDGPHTGCIPTSRDSPESGCGSSASSKSTKTYVDNPYNRKLGRVGLPHAAAVVSKSGSNGSSPQKTYGNTALNRCLGRVGLPIGCVPVSRNSSERSCVSSASSESTKTYVDNPYNRKLGQVGLPHGAAVVSKAGSNGKTTSSSPSSSYSGKVYTDNPINRRLGRVGRPLGSMPISTSSSTKSSTSPKVYVDNPYNRALGRAGKPFGSMPVSKKSKKTNAVRDLFQRLRDHPDEDLQLVETDNDEYTADLVVGLINRQDEVEKWQKETGSTRNPQTPAELCDRYEGEVILYEEVDLRKKIGHGGFGDVYFAKWNQSVVALKKLRVQCESNKRLKGFIQELTVFCTLEHKNIVKFIGACVVLPNLAIVMEYMDCSLHEAIHLNDEREFSDAERLSLIEQIMNGLKYLHSKRIAHCDLKSQNVLLDLADHPIAKLTDFGLSMVRVEPESTVSVKERVRFVGTPRYSAPEVLRGELLTRENMLDADMYSVSLVVFEIICEEEPFPQLNYFQLCKHVGEGMMTPDIPDKITISDSLERRMRSCWNRDPDERPTASSFWSTVKSLKSLLEE